MTPPIGLAMAIYLVFQAQSGTGPAEHTWRVDGGAAGNDTGPGTYDQPFKTIEKTLSVAEPGDTVRIASGVYPGPVTISRSGMNGKAITLEAAECHGTIMDAGWKAAFCLTCPPEVSYITLRALVLRGAKSHGVRVRTGWRVEDGVIEECGEADRGSALDVRLDDEGRKRAEGVTFLRTIVQDCDSNGITNKEALSTMPRPPAAGCREDRPPFSRPASPSTRALSFSLTLGMPYPPP